MRLKIMVRSRQRSQRKVRSTARVADTDARKRNHFDATVAPLASRSEKSSLLLAV